MGHTNQTANYNLPQFVGTDKPSWLGDINDAFAAIDSAIAAAATEATTADGKADALTTTVSGHTTQIGVLQNTVTTQGNTLNTVTSLIGNGTPTTTDQTIIGAINELNAKEGNLSDLTTTDKSSLVAAINEAAQSGGGEGGHTNTITADGTKTYSQLLDDLFALVNISKLNGKSYLKEEISGATNFWNLISIPSSGEIRFSAASTTVGSPYTETIKQIIPKTSGSAYIASGADIGSTVATSGIKYTIYY